MGGTLEVRLFSNSFIFNDSTLSFFKGAIGSHMFAGGGSEDGCIRLWDLRKPSRIMETVRGSIVPRILL